MKNAIINLTRELLNSGAFSHLPDDEISRMHWLLLQNQSVNEYGALEKMISYWYKGDYYASEISMHLLQQCNECLQGIGRPMIYVYSEDFFEL
ncbi:MAG: hypothetical protein JST96_00795 [Bacteroidetes bacterium]|nr:hypothetical protein [Bacteroidota bacterium]